MECAKCKQAVADGDVIRCSACMVNMHYLCAPFTELEFKKILPMNKLKWKCVACKNKKVITSTKTSSPKQVLDSNSSILNVDTEALTAYLDAKFKSLCEQWREDIQQAIKNVTNIFKQDVQNLNNRIDLCEENITRIDQKLDLVPSIQNDADLKLENDLLRQDLVDLQDRLDDLDQSARSCNVEIQNVPAKKGENLVQLASNLGQLIGVEIPAEAIKAVHRVAQGVGAINRPKNIILQLTTRRLRDDIIAAARSRRTLSTSDLFAPSNAAEAADSRRFYINEHLTLRKKILFSRARDLAKEKGYKYVWVRNANIMLRKIDEGRVLHIRNDKDLQKI